MIKLVVDDTAQLTILDYLLQTHGIEYESILNDGRYGIPTPYLLVYGAPLDEERAIKWIRYRQEDDYCE
jgi:hypothetical protein